MALAEARLARDVARRRLAEGDDPVWVKTDAKLATRLRMGTNFEAVARAWFEHWAGPRSARHANYVQRRLEADVFPVIGRNTIGEITAPQLLAKRIESRGAVDIAKRALHTCGQILRYAVAHGLLEYNPAADVKPSDALKPRRRESYARFDTKDVPQLLRRIDACEGTPTIRLAMMPMALTFVRTGDLIGARWRESTCRPPNGASRPSGRRCARRTSCCCHARPSTCWRR